MRRYTVVVAGQTVNLLLNGSGGSTPSRRTNFGSISERQSWLTVNQLPYGFTGSSPVTTTNLM